MAKPAVRPLLVVLAAALGSACNPYGASLFTCDVDDNCGTGGKCEPDRRCSFPDEAKCGPDGRSYGEHSGDQTGQCVNPDAGVDAPIDTPDEVCFGSAGGLMVACFSTRPTGTPPLSGTIDTDASPLCVATTRPVAACVIAGDDIQLNGGDTVTAIGSRPLVLVAVDALTISGTIDAASHRDDTDIGAGGNPAGAGLCNAGTLPSANRGGGAGGAFGDAGGNGGDPGHGIAGAPNPAGLRGGCRGQDGRAGRGDNNRRGIGGNGGGAIYLIAGQTLTINGGGIINASGAGGTGGRDQESGGGGGGSGGLIGLDAPTVTNNGTLFANGGGGGAGSGSAGAGGSGDDPTGTGEAAGGIAGAGGAGGQGGGGADQSGDNGASSVDEGAGAGGGGVGVIRVFSPNPLVGSGQLSPPPS